MKKFFDRFRRKTNNESQEMVAKLTARINELELALQGISKMSRESKIDKVRHNWIQARAASALKGDTLWTTVKKPTKRG